MLIPSSRTNKYIRHLLKVREPFVIATREHPTDPFKPLQTIFTDRFIMLDMTGKPLPVLPYSDSTEPTAHRYCWTDSEQVKKMTAEVVFKLWDEWTATPEDECVPLEVTDTLEMIDGILPVHLLRAAAGVTTEQIIARRSKKYPASSLRADGTLMLSKTYIRMLATDLRELQRCAFSLDDCERIVIRSVYPEEDRTPFAVVMPLAKFTSPVSRATAGGTVGII